jgi:hypothetical protein
MEEATCGANETREEMVRSWARHRFHVRMFARCSRGAYTRRMDPFSQYLSPFLPLAFLVAAVVAFVREMSATTDPLTKTKRLRIDGKARVLPLVAVISLFVVVWSQYHASPTSPLNWLRIAGETPAVFFLAAGGSSFVQRLKDRSRFTFLEDTTSAISDVVVTDTADGPQVKATHTSTVVAEHPGSLLMGVLDETSDPLAKAKSMSVPVADVREALGIQTPAATSEKGADTPDEIVKP